MKLLAGVAVTVIAGGAVYAQTQDDATATRATTTATEDTATREEISANEPDPELLRQQLKQRAIRIPKRGLAAALRASSDGRSDRAETLAREPDLGALREDLQRTSEADAERQTDTARLSASPNFTTAVAVAPPPGIRPLSADRLKSADRKEVEQVQIPVLIPADASIRDKVKVYGMKNIYTATAEIDKSANLSISGTCNRVVGGDPNVVAFRRQLADEKPRLTRAGAAYHISRNDFGVDLSFSKFGCGYVMTIECNDPSADPRCAADDYVVGLADSMILANPDLAGGQ